MNIPHAKKYLWWNPHSDKNMIYFAALDASWYYVLENENWKYGTAYSWTPNLVNKNICSIYTVLTKKQLMNKLCKEYFVDML